MVSGGGAFGRYLHREGEALVNGISDLKRPTELHHLCGHSEKLAVCNLAEGPHQNLTMLAP